MTTNRTSEEAADTVPRVDGQKESVQSQRNSSMSNPTRFSDELENTIEALDRNRRGRIHIVAHHNDDGTRTYMCGKVSSPNALKHALPDAPRCQACDAMQALDADLDATVHPSIQTALAVLNAIDDKGAGQ